MEYRVGLIGKGVVGTAFIDLLRTVRHKYKQEYDLELKLVAIFEKDGALIDDQGIKVDEIYRLDQKLASFTYWKEYVKAIDIIGNLNLNLVIETTPTRLNTGEPALSHIYAAIKSGIDVITSNKAPLYLKFQEIKQYAKEKGILIRYEATVASCVPCLSIKENLANIDIIGIRAILNGTSNYILSRMTSEGLDFESALKESQELGYAESDPSLDIEGFDAAGKLVILANELLGYSKSISDVEVKGISKITPQAIELAKSERLAIKQIAIAKNDRLIVEPRLIEQNSPLNIDGTLNVVELEANKIGSIILIGRGAGGYEAAYAILNDLDFILKERYS
jgi:homoserine dehydrogenase